MQIDKTTLSDLSIFHSDEEHSVFHYFNFTTSTGGKDWLKHLFAHPYIDIKKITDTQQTIKLILHHHNAWPTIITNGTIMVIEKFYETPLEPCPLQPNYFASLSYKFFNSADCSMIKYSVNHFADFAIGLELLISIFDNEQLPDLLKNIINRIKALLNKDVIHRLISLKKQHNISLVDYLTFGMFLKNTFKDDAQELIDLYSHLDALYSMAIACKKFSLTFPAMHIGSTPYIVASDLYHPLLKTPVAYNLTLNQQANFLFLTGANMAGKSTFIKAVGVAVYLAHLGMGVPARDMQLSLFDGLLSNIHVEDNIARGESYFFNEVQRIKKTIDKINDGRNWLILIDELFKGTNVQDATKCSIVVIEGLLKMKNALFILSTHLYEIADNLRQHSNITFNYFETSIADGQLVFSYRLKEGISNDRLGYLILKREGVVEMLEKL